MNTQFSDWPVLECILRQLCEMVNCDYDSFNFQRNRWYTQFRWTEEQEKEFKKWMYKYIMNYRPRKDIYVQLGFWPHSAKSCKEFCSYFMFQYGWSLIDQNKINKLKEIKKL